MSSLQLDHVAIPIADARRSLQFYTEVLSLPLVSAMSGEDWGGHPWMLMFFKLADGRLVALTALAGCNAIADSGLPTDARHYALATDDLEAWRQRLARQRVQFREEVHGTQHSLFIEDPDRTVWEITCPASPIAFAEDAAGAQQVVQRWLEEHR